MIRQQILILTSFYFIFTINSEVVQHQFCNSEIPLTSNNNNSTIETHESSRCDIHEVRITPCPEASIDKNTRCNIKRGSVMKIEFDFSPANNHSIDQQIHKVGSHRGYFSWHNWFKFSFQRLGHYSFNVSVDKSTLPVSKHFF